MQSFIGIYLDSLGGALTKLYGLEPFWCWCISPRETLCDKLSRLARLSQKPDNSGYAEHVRDFYDVVRMTGDEGLRNFLESDDFLPAMYLTNNQDWLQHKSPHTRESYARCRLFSNPREVLKDRAVSRTYAGLGQLLFRGSSLPSSEEVIATLEHISRLLVRFDEYRTERDGVNQ